ncbi:MAG: hypothetical protein AUJ49_03395 [Desulfovibrionaceae bacterium CG1_02_65_16]|nr:MAG: hypothetical protein AUJ49_03395 [Desulfovibrionaceae bacterium CG1_02_65_16]
MRKSNALLLACAATAALTGCVATQKVPVSTDPVGAAVYLDGKPVCQATPCSVEMPKDTDHLLTIVKDGYRQRDVPVRRVFDAMGVLRQSARDGVRAAKFGGGLSGGISSAANSVDEQEKDGRAYVLKPDMVSLRLLSVTEPEPQEKPAENEKNSDPAVDLGMQLYRMLDGGQGDQNGQTGQ